LELEAGFPLSFPLYILRQLQAEEMGPMGNQDLSIPQIVAAVVLKNISDSQLLR
jgi:hypothetical protein